jgi:hypothetical protein
MQHTLYHTFRNKVPLHPCTTQASRPPATMGDATVTTTLKRIGFFCFPIKHSTHTEVRLASSCGVCVECFFFCHRCVSSVFFLSPDGLRLLCRRVVAGLRLFSTVMRWVCRVASSTVPVSEAGRIPQSAFSASSSQVSPVMPMHFASEASRAAWTRAICGCVLRRYVWSARELGLSRLLT